MTLSARSTSCQPQVFLLLVLDVFLDRLFVTPNRTDEIAARPEALPDEIASPLAVRPHQMDCALAFDVPDHVRHRVFWRDRQQHVNVIRKQMSLFDFRFFLSRELTKDFAHRPPQFLKEHFASILRDENHVVFAVPGRVV
jgi:hypothetical protein